MTSDDSQGHGPGPSGHPAPRRFVELLGPSGMAAVVMRASLHKAVQGEVVLEAGHSASSLGVVDAGVALECVRRGDTWIAAEVVGVGDLIGETDLLADSVRTRRVIAATEVRYSAISRTAFDELSQRQPRFADAVRRYLVERRRDLAHRQVAASETHPKAMFARTLVNLYDIFTRAGWMPSGEIPLPRIHLAGVTGVHRGHLSLYIQDLRARSLVASGPQYVTIVDIENLRDHAYVS